MILVFAKFSLNLSIGTEIHVKHPDMNGSFIRLFVFLKCSHF